MPAHLAALETGQIFANAFEAMEEEYFRARAVDVREISHLVARLIVDAEAQEESYLPADPVLLVADDLSPGELLRWGKQRLLGLILHRSSPNGHTAILARAMDLPAITGVPSEARWHGLSGVLEGHDGRLWLEPDQSCLEQMEQAQNRSHSVTYAPACLRNGQTIPLLANIGSGVEADFALAQGADGIGLFRSEFLFLARSSCPSEEEQFLAYRHAALAMDGRPVVIRTLDAGADKPLPYLDLPDAPNPALGLRGIRLSLARPELFRPQLRAILRAAAWGRLSVLFPMVTSPEEVRQAKAILAQCRAELEAEQIPCGPLSIGIMIETPAAALLADQLAQEVSFFSIGTNDLTQYTLATDRLSTDASYDPHSPAVLALIQMAAEAAHRHGCGVTLCGELGTDPTMTEQLLRLGVEEFSVSPAALPQLRAHMQQLDLAPQAT
jgi:phosphotransferase system enzyme I (PtsI)